MREGSKDKASEVEKLKYRADDDLIDWYGRLEAFFEPRKIDDITDIDNEASLAYVYLISLNRNNESLSSEEIDLLLEREDAYFACVNISRVKPLIFWEFWRYPKEWKGQKLEVTEGGFMKEHEPIRERLEQFAMENQLHVLNEKDLRQGLDRFFKEGGFSEEDYS